MKSPRELHVPYGPKKDHRLYNRWGRREEKRLLERLRKQVQDERDDDDEL